MMLAPEVFDSFPDIWAAYAPQKVMPLWATIRHVQFMECPLGPNSGHSQTLYLHMLNGGLCAQVRPAMSARSPAWQRLTQQASAGHVEKHWLPKSGGRADDAFQLAGQNIRAGGRHQSPRFHPGRLARSRAGARTGRAFPRWSSSSKQPYRVQFAECPGSWLSRSICDREKGNVGLIS